MCSAERMKRRMSILEFFMGLICCSKGTVSETELRS